SRCQEERLPRRQPRASKIPRGARAGRRKCPGATANSGTGRAWGSGSVQCGDDEVDAEDDDESADAEDRPVGELKRRTSAPLLDPIEVRGAHPHRRGEQRDDDACRDPGRGGNDEARAPFDHFASPLSLASAPVEEAPESADVPAAVDSAFAPLPEFAPLPAFAPLAESVPLPELAPDSASVSATDPFFFAFRAARRFSLAACFSSHASRRAFRLAMARLRLRSLRSLRLRPRILTASPTVSKPERSVSST